MDRNSLWNVVIPFMSIFFVVAIAHTAYNLGRRDGARK